MIGCLRTRVRKQPIIALYFESENVLRFYNLEASWVRASGHHCRKIKGNNKFGAKNINIYRQKKNRW